MWLDVSWRFPTIFDSFTILSLQQSSFTKQGLYFLPFVKMFSCWNAQNAMKPCNSWDWVVTDRQTHTHKQTTITLYLHTPVKYNYLYIYIYTISFILMPSVPWKYNSKINILEQVCTMNIIGFLSMILAVYLMVQSIVFYRIEDIYAVGLTSFYLKWCLIWTDRSMIPRPFVKSWYCINLEWYCLIWAFN